MPILNIQEGCKHPSDVFTDLPRVVDGQNRVPYSSLVGDYTNSANASRSTHLGQQNQPLPHAASFHWTRTVRRGGYCLLADNTLMGDSAISN